MTLRDRIARLYAAHPEGERAEAGTAGRRGLGQTWLARQSGRVLPEPVAPRTVRDWVRRGRLPPIGVILVERLEEEAGLRAA